MSEEIRTKETQRGFATEWADAQARIIRRGDEYTLSIRVLGDLGCYENYSIKITEREAGDVRGIWVET